MKDKVYMFIIGLLVGAIVTSLGFVLFDNKAQKEMDNIKMKERSFTPPSGDAQDFDPSQFKGDFDPSNIDLNNIDTSKIPQRPDGDSKRPDEQSDKEERKAKAQNEIKQDLGIETKAEGTV